MPVPTPTEQQQFQTYSREVALLALICRGTMKRLDEEDLDALCGFADEWGLTLAEMLAAIGERVVG